MPELGGTHTVRVKVTGADQTTVVTLEVVAPSGEVLTPVVSGSAGTYSASVLVDETGWWLARWTVTGAAANVRSTRWYVVDGPAQFGVWPPSLADLKLDMGDTDPASDAKDPELVVVLAAAVAKVRELKGGTWDLSEDGEESGTDLTPPDAALILGTLRLAARWHTRRSSWDNMVNLADGASTPVPGFDADIDRLLRIGRYAPPVEQFA